MADLTLRNVDKTFGNVEVLKKIDLSVADGEFVVLVGPSGCGKSTLLRLISGLEETSGGEMEIGGRNVIGLSPAQREIAMVFQSYALYPHMSVRKNLSFGLENLRLPRAEIDGRVLRAAKMLGLEPYLDRKPKALSGGQRQRVAIGRSIVREPALFLFDEPLSNLDAKLRVQTRGEIIKLHRELGATMIYVTHDQVEAMTMADRIVVMNAGRTEQIGTPLELFDTPANLFVAGFIGSPKMNFFEARARKTSTTVEAEVTGLGRVTLPVAPGDVDEGEKLVIGIRPSHTIVGEGPFSMAVEYQESLGTETFVYGRLDGVAELAVLHVQHHYAARPGEALAFDLPQDRLHVFRATNEQRVPTHADRARGAEDGPH